MGVAFANAVGDRIYVSQYSTSPVGIIVHVAGVPGPADGAVNASMESIGDDPTLIFSRAADNPDLGIYEVTLSSVETATVGTYRLEWNYTIGGTAQMYAYVIEVGPASQDYDTLPEGMRGIVDSVWNRFADMFDSPLGGPHLQVYFQTRFGRGRMAQLLDVAMGRLNTISQPFTTYSVYPSDDGTVSEFPLSQWGPLLTQGLYIEVIKHLIRSYVEQPNDPGVSVARLDRRDYMNRWETVLRGEQDDFQAQLDNFKMAHMGLGRPGVMVAGGIYARGKGMRGLPNSIIARPRYPWRYH